MTFKQLVILSSSSSLLCFLPWTAAFAPRAVLKNQKGDALRVGGKGWDSDSYLDNLSGDDDEEERSAAAQESYKEFQESRQAFLERQQSYRNDDDRNRKFMQNRRAQMQTDEQEEMPQEEVLPNKMGGTRFAKMMNKSQQHMKQRGGFLEQKFAIPLDDDDDKEE